MIKAFSSTFLRSRILEGCADQAGRRMLKRGKRAQRGRWGHWISNSHNLPFTSWPQYLPKLTSNLCLHPIAHLKTSLLKSSGQSFNLPDKYIAEQKKNACMDA
jgi:hypothetical protein